MSKLIRYFGDIRFWIIFFFIIRLYGITQPPLEIAHNWRQTTVTMVARNFAEVDNNILYPRIDIAGEKTGITGMEFPLLNYLIYLASIPFGYNHWYGRLINLIISSCGLYFFFLLVRKYFSKKVAFNSTIILLFSIWFAYSRKIMPDTFSVSLVIAGLYYGTNYLENKNITNLIISSLLVLAGALAKLPSVCLLFVLAIFFVRKDISLSRKIILTSCFGIAGVITGLWYFYWVPHLVQEYGFWHFFMGKSIIDGFYEIQNELGKTLQNFYDNSLKFIGFAAFLAGLIFAIIKKNKLVISIFGIVFIPFLLIIFKSGTTFAHHAYYMIPFVPIMALVAGYGIAQINYRYIPIILLLAIGIEGFANQIHDFRIPQKQQALYNLENDLNKVSNQNDLLLINSGEYPTAMYFAHRKGWVEYNNFISNKSNIDRLREKGLKNIVILKKTTGTNIDLDYPIAYNSDDYTIYYFND